MAGTSSLLRTGSRSFVSLIATIVGSTGWLHADEPFVFSGYSVGSPKFEMVINPFGYSDSMNDLRSKFAGREYLSGEWAAAVYYEGGNLPAMSRWLTDRFVFPDFLTGTNFMSKFEPPFMLYSPNIYGLPVVGSTILNQDLEIRMSYEMWDLGKPLAGRLAIGLAPHSAGGVGSYLPAGRYVFRQNYQITNISGNTLSNVKLFQFLHTLQGDWGVYDGRDYGGGLPEYRYGISIQGKSFGFNQRTYETVEHTDTVAMKYSIMPSGFELGSFGIKGMDSHQTGEPSVGVHESVASNSLNGSDFFDQDLTDWIAGAVSFNLGSLAPDASISVDVLVAINTSYEVIHPPIKLVIHNARLANGLFTIDFEETTRNPLVGYVLRQSMTLGPTSPLEWDPVGVPYSLNTPMPTWNRFQAPVDPMMTPRNFFAVVPIVINEE